MDPRLHSFPSGLLRLARHPDRWKFEAVGPGTLIPESRTFVFEPELATTPCVA